MPSQPIFRFKQFAVALDKCAMKVNTDGTLLGAWTDPAGAATILDIGTGTGVLAMMMAQSNQDAIIDAIDIDEAACIQAGENFAACPWHSRLAVRHVSLQDFVSDRAYDVIITNPPYFIDDSNGLDQRKNSAKHSITMTYDDLISGIDRLLAADGRAYVVLPVFNLPVFQEIAGRASLYITRRADVIAVKGKTPYVTLIRMERAQREFQIDTIQIQDANGVFTNQYRELTKDFYLKF
jgi:tRNA1Val (adenine37-N6)-methyltransferase